MADLVERQAVMDTVAKSALDLNDPDENWIMQDRIKEIPSAQPEPSTEIQEILEYLDTTLHPIVSPDNWNVYAELHDMVSKLPSAQPEPQWIPCSEPPKESGTYIVTAYDGTDKRVTFVKYQKTLKRWDLTGARSYWHILAYKPLPEPWRGEEHETD